MMRECSRFFWKSLGLMAMTFFLFPATAHASTGGGVLPFVQSLRTIMDDVTGPVATILIFIGIAIALVAWGTSDRHDKIVTAGKGLVALAIIATLAGTLAILGINAATL
jgi:type IV secretory pathway VirB2 component (pilin)